MDWISLMASVTKAAEIAKNVDTGSLLASVTTEQGIIAFIVALVAALIFKITKKILHLVVILAIAAAVVILPTLVG